MSKTSMREDGYLNDYHKHSSLALQKETKAMQERPWSVEKMIVQSKALSSRRDGRPKRKF